jgi:zinc protease
MEDLSAASLEDIAHFFALYYTPDNAVLSIAGDFDPSEARQLEEEYYGPIPRGSGRPPLPPMDVPPIFGEWKREVVADAVMLPRLYLAFRSPVFGSDGYYAASVCGAILGMRRGSRLHRALVRERQVAAEATAFTFDLPKGSDLLVVDVTARPGVDAETLEREVVREIDALQTEGVTDGEVERALALIETDFIASMQAAGDRADKLSMFATYFGDPRLLNEQVERYRNVTSADVNAFIRQRLGPDNRASLLYVPREEDAEATDVANLAATGV